MGRRWLSPHPDLRPFLTAREGRAAAALSTSPTGVDAMTITDDFSAAATHPCETVQEIAFRPARARRHTQPPRYVVAVICFYEQPANL